jgi:hypothetical protein
MELKAPKVKDIIEKFIVKPGKNVKLKDFDSGWSQNEKMKTLGEDKSRQILEAML